jgi:hypothetical protein
MQSVLVREAQVLPKQIYLSYFQLVERGLWWQFCDIRNYDLFAVHKGKIKENKRFRLTPYEIRRLGLCKIVQR